jgi:hypothetical protein
LTYVVPPLQLSRLEIRLSPGYEAAGTSQQFEPEFRRTMAMQSSPQRAAHSSNDADMTKFVAPSSPRPMLGCRAACSS